MTREKKHLNPTPWRVERWRGAGRQPVISIIDADGLALANMVGQIAENQYEIAKRIVAAVNATP